MNIEVVSSDMDDMVFDSSDQDEDNFKTPVARPAEFTVAAETDAQSSPSKPKSMSRAVSKAKSFVRSFVQRRATRKVSDRHHYTTHELNYVDHRRTRAAWKPCPSQPPRWQLLAPSREGGGR